MMQPISSFGITISVACVAGVGADAAAKIFCRGMYAPIAKLANAASLMSNVTNRSEPHGYQVMKWKDIKKRAVEHLVISW